MDVMARRRTLLMQQQAPAIINLCPAATGTDIANSWPSTSGSRRYTVIGLDPAKDYTIQVTITRIWTRTTSRRLYLYNETSSGKYIDTALVESVPLTKTFTTKPTADGELTISHNANALNDAEYAASLTNIMLEVGSVAHPFVPYVAP